MAIIRLKQALGRSMRREHQRSLTLILDRRIVGKRYGKQIVNSLAKEVTVKLFLDPKLMRLLIDFK